MSDTTCSLCGEEIGEADMRDRHHQAVAWHPDLGRSRGGPNTKGKFSHDTGAFAHGRCVDSYHRKQKLGISVRQPGLF